MDFEYQLFLIDFHIKTIKKLVSDDTTVALLNDQIDRLGAEITTFLKANPKRKKEFIQIQKAYAYKKGNK